ncbi:MAG: SUMF1/EgtB/PvdO family nonheme iron enzyme, partial [Caldilineaceae bacterium]|nr:SUMF1/EgtB/PvdO family nonheme iron enzyme [Caldilineaceae bacterium]
AEFARILNHYLNLRQRDASWLAGRLPSDSTKSRKRTVDAGTVRRWCNGETTPKYSAIVDAIVASLQIESETDRLSLYAAAGFLAVAATPASLTMPAAATPEPLAPLKLTPAHLHYLRSWFGKTWADVTLADIVEESDRRVSLLDVYVPLPVDFGVTVVTQDQQIIDWWAAPKPPERDGRDERRLARELAAHMADDFDAAQLARELPKLRHWPDLNVDEAALSRVIQRIQEKILTEAAAEAGKQRYQDDEHWWHMEAHDAASVQLRFVLLGDPGSGKSSFLHHLALCLAGELRRRTGEQDVPDQASLAALRDWLLDAYTPIYIELRDLVRLVFPPLPEDDRPAAAPTADHFWRYVREQVLGPGLLDFEEDLRTLCAEGRAILLLDGLDEVGQSVTKQRRDQLQSFVAALVRTYPHLRIVVTSRPHAYSNGWALTGFGKAMLEPLSLSRLHELAQALFPLTFSEGAQDEALAFVKALAQAEEAGQLDRKLYANPLFFTLLAALWLDAAPPRRFPTTRAELLRQGVDLLLKRWTRRRLPDPSVAERLGVLQRDDLRQVLESLACTVHATAQPGADSTLFSIDMLLGMLARADCRVLIQDVPDYLTQHAGILVSPAPHVFYFIHRSFQEHLAASLLICARPTTHRPPVEEWLRFPHGLVTLTLAQPELWENVARLAADDLFAHTSRVLDGWQLLTALASPYLEQQQAPAAALLALQIAQSQRLFEQEIGRFDPRTASFSALVQTAQAILVDPAHFVPEQRLLAGDLLAARPGLDQRPGVTVRPDNGLPDIVWCEIPEFSRDGKREFLHHDGTRNTPHEGLSTFWIAKYPITYAQFQAFVDAPDGYRNPEWRKNPDIADLFGEDGTRWKQNWPIANRPRENVSWPEAVAFCRWLTAKARQHPELLPDDEARKVLAQGGSIRLPTEHEWVKAACGFDDRMYPWGGQEYQVGYANVDETEDKTGPHNLRQTSAVGMYPHAASPFGVEELSGNVWEYCLNKHNDPDDLNLGGDDWRAVRGGSWYTNSAGSSVAARGVGFDGNFGFGGFRVVCAASPSLGALAL